MIVYVTENWWLVPVIIIALGVAAIAGYLILIAVTERPRRRKKNKRKSRLDLFDCKKCIYDGCPPGCKWTWFEPPKCYNCDLGDKGKTKKCVCGEKATRAEVKAGQCKFFKERN